MDASTYNIVRVNRPGMNLPAAMHDMQVIIEAGYFWKKSSTPYMPEGSLLLAMGSHGGRGLFIFGIVTGEWEDEPDGDEYHKRLPVQWQYAVYKHDPSVSDNIAGMAGFNLRFGKYNLLPGEFADVLSVVMKGTVLSPDYLTQPDAVA